MFQLLRYGLACPSPSPRAGSGSKALCPAIPTRAAASADPGNSAASPEPCPGGRSLPVGGDHGRGTCGCCWGGLAGTSLLRQLFGCSCNREGWIEVESMRLDFDLVSPQITQQLMACCGREGLLPGPPLAKTPSVGSVQGNDY